MNLPYSTNSTNVLKTPSQTAIATACTLLQQGELVAIATETVYGLAGDATNDTACQKIYTTKGRPSNNPLIVHVPNLAMAQEIGVFSDTALLLANTYWAGALTLVVPLRTDSDCISIAPTVTAGLNTVAIRIPARDSTRELLTQFGKPIAAPSANPSGRLSPTTADHVMVGLGGKIPLILDDGACTVGVESTIVDTTQSPPVILRAGGITVDCLNTTLSQNLSTARPDNIAPKSAGMLTHHYAPTLPIRMNVTAPNDNELVLGFGNMGGHINLSPTGDLAQSACSLFDALHQLDSWNATHGTAYTGIAVAPIPNTGLGVAINDRLTRATAPKTP